MKIIQLLLTILFCLALTVVAQDFRLSYDGKSGDVDLDAQIKDINISATANTDGTLKELEVTVGIPPKECDRIVTTYKISYGEVYLLGVIRLKSKKTLEEILVLRSQGLGWGVIAKRLGLHPSTLNKAMREMRKAHKQKHIQRKGKSKGKGT
ncbi:MAG TPA: helix-turn-helix domain-containing protein [Bacteroidota bacterium]|nr:helix-turn-helix domain-containing protein [Bacteroidota bacterium]